MTYWWHTVDRGEWLNLANANTQKKAEGEKNMKYAGSVNSTDTAVEC